MKQLQLIITLSILTFNAYGQTNCSELKTKLNQKEEIIVTQKANITKLENEVNYYKETLNLMNGKVRLEQDNFILIINSVIGKSNSGTVIIEGIVENKGIVRAFRPSGFRTFIYDPKGNNYEASKIKFGTLSHIQEFQKNTPVKFTLVFDKIGEEMPLITNLTAIFTNARGERYTDMIFKNLPVIWE